MKIQILEKMDLVQESQKLKNEDFGPGESGPGTGLLKIGKWSIWSQRLWLW